MKLVLFYVDLSVWQFFKYRCSNKENAYVFNF
jgi:hypothetical protein